MSEDIAEAKNREWVNSSKYKLEKEKLMDMKDMLSKMNRQQRRAMKAQMRKKRVK